MSVILKSVSLTGKTSFSQPINSAEFITPGTYSFIVPDGVTSISAVCVGAGGGATGASSGVDSMWRGGAGGGGLRYINALPVTPGETITVEVGEGAASDGIQAVTAPYGGTSQLKRSSNVLVAAFGGQSVTSAYAVQAGGTGTDIGTGPYGGTIGGGDGGSGDKGGITFSSAGGGGAAGYSGNGGNSVEGISGGNNGSGGGGASGGSYSYSDGGGGGGGVGIYGIGANGVAPGVSIPALGGGGGSGGTAGAPGSEEGGTGNGGLFGGGGGGGAASGSPAAGTRKGGGGAIRIIWGAGRSYPSNAA